MFVLHAEHTAESCKSIYFCVCSHYVRCSCWVSFAGTEKPKVLRNFSNLSVKIRGQYAFDVSVLLTCLQVAIDTSVVSYGFLLGLL